MTYSTVCASCSKRFDAAHPAARTCSAACRQALVRDRRRAAKRAVAAQLREGLRGDAAAMAAGLGGALALLAD